VEESRLSNIRSWLTTNIRQQKHDVRGKKQNIKSGVGKMAMNTFKDQAEKSSVRLNNVHTDKIHSLAKSVTDIRSELPVHEDNEAGF